MAPQRIRLSRAKGFNLQESSTMLNGLPVVNVARRGKWGNPFVVGEDGTAAECVNSYSLLLAGFLCASSTVSVDDQVKAIKHAALNIRLYQRRLLMTCYCPFPRPD